MAANKPAPAATPDDVEPSDAERDELEARARKMWGPPTSLIYDAPSGRLRVRLANLRDRFRHRVPSIDEYIETDRIDDGYLHLAVGLSSGSDCLTDEECQEMRRICGTPTRTITYLGNGDCHDVNLDLKYLTWENQLTGETGGLPELRRRTAAAACLTQLERLLVDAHQCEPAPDGWRDVVERVIALGEAAKANS